MRLRRCALLVIEPRETQELDLPSLFGGGDGLAAQRRLVALAPHLQREVEIEAADVAVLAAVPVQRWSEADVLEREHGRDAVQRLLALGLLIGDDEAGREVRDADERLRATGWHPLNAAAHYFSRWQDVRSGEAARRAGYDTVNDLVEKLGPPPPAVEERCSATQRIALAPPQTTAFDTLLQQRTTCRNFDTSTVLDNKSFCTMLHRVFGAQALLQIQPGNVVIKRNSPSGGGLHPLTAYVLVQRVQGVAAGVYHYHPIAHALEPLAELDPAAADALALTSVAAQRYFADAPVLVLLVARFSRSFWKYRNHSKAYRVAVLDAGHLSQNLYLSATDLGLGAFVTGAINEIEIEQALGLDPLRVGVLAVCGFGTRAAEYRDDEFDPLGRVWPPAG